MIHSFAVASTVVFFCPVWNVEERQQNKSFGQIHLVDFSYLGCTCYPMKSTIQIRVDVAKEAKKRAKDAIGPVPKAKVIPDKRFKSPKHKKSLEEVQ